MRSPRSRFRTPHSAFRTRSSLRLWARLRPTAPGEIQSPAEATPQPAPTAPAIDIHTGTLVLPSAQARPSAGPTLILPLLFAAILIAPSVRASAPHAFSAVNNFRVTPCTLPPVPPRENTSRPIQALTGTLTKTETRLGATQQRVCRDCSDLPTGRLARLSPALNSQPSTINCLKRLARLSPPALAQITIKSIPAELWALAATVVGFLSWLAKKLWSRNAKPKPEYITRAEFHHEMTATRDRIGASYLALADKIEQQHNQVLTKLDRQGVTFESRLDRLENSVARLDERTRSGSPHH